MSQLKVKAIHWNFGESAEVQNATYPSKRIQFDVPKKENAQTNILNKKMGGNH